MIQITEDKLKAAIQIALGSKGVYTHELETIIIHDVKALSIPVVINCPECNMGGFDELNNKCTNSECRLWF